jgi:sugar phosphate isomerase/epimerase
MQGRLLPKYKGRYQAHPVGYWKDEFQIASQFGLDCIEFIIDYEGAEANPMLSDGGQEEIIEVVDRTGVAVKTVCADFFMEAPLHSAKKETVSYALEVLSQLIRTGFQIGLSDIVIPCVDNSSIKDGSQMERFIARLSSALPEAEAANINLALETDLGPQEFAKLLDRFSSRRVTVNYDTGNSASLGFDPVEEMDCYGGRISDIHIKDRLLGGGSVELGTGDVQFGKFFDALARCNYEGPFILQAYRDDEGLEIFKKQLSWFLPSLSRWGAGGRCQTTT